MQYQKHFALLLIFLVVTVSVSFAQRSGRMRRGNSSSTFLEDSAVISAAEYMLHIESLYQKIDRIQSESKLDLGVLTIDEKLKETDSILYFVNQSLLKYNETLNLRNLQMFTLLVEHEQHALKLRHATLKVADKNLLTLRSELMGVRRDSLLRQLIRDTVARKSFLPQLRGLRQKRRMTDSLLRSNLTTVNMLKTRASSANIMASQLMSRLSNQLNTAGKAIFSKEYSYLWEAPIQVSHREFKLRNTYQSEQKALNFYFATSSGSRILMWLAGILFFWWISKNRRYLKGQNKMGTLQAYDVTYLALHPLAASFVVMFCFAPLFDLQAPAAYIEVVQFLLLIALTFVVYGQWSKRLRYYWIGILVLFVLFSLTTHILAPGFFLRCCMITLNVLSALLWILFLRELPEQRQLKRFIKYVLLLQVLMNIAAVICNIYGRLSLAQVFSTTSIYAFTQVIGLSVMVKTLLEAMVLQIHVSRLKHSLEKHFNDESIVAGLRKPLLFLVVVIWLIVFTTNLNIYSTLFDSLFDFLSKNRSLGNTSFTLYSVLLFFLIIWAAHFIQRYIGYFLGDIGDEEEGESVAHRSKLLMARLVLLGAGYLLAVAASGLPVDKITIVLGALGVGIGLGLQNIVSNFVSGIILIFDRPLEVGDSVEIGNKSGRVKEIGLRSSTLSTTDGAEVIIPNGDMLSQHIVNWTLSNNYKRTGMDIQVSTSVDADTVMSMIKDVVRSSDRILKKREPVVLLEDISDGHIKLKLYFWCEDIYKADQTESEVRYLIYKELKEKGMGVK